MRNPSRRMDPMLDDWLDTVEEHPLTRVIGPDVLAELRAYWTDEDIQDALRLVIQSSNE